MIRCALAGYPLAGAEVVSRANVGLAGNLVIGGGLGAAIDVGTGAAYTYPTWVQLVFGEDRLFDRSDNRSDGPTTGTRVRATTAAAPGSATTTSTAAAPIANLPAWWSALQRGDSLEYVLTDRLTGNRTSVVYNVDRVSGDEISFNNRSRVEKLDGRVVSIGSAAGGYFDGSSPPDGWGRTNLQAGMRWRADYVATAGERWRHELVATVVGAESFRVEDVEVPVQRIEWSGWIFMPSGAAQISGTRFKATVLYSDVLHRVIRFESEHKPNSGAWRRKTLQLVRLLR